MCTASRGIIQSYQPMSYFGEDGEIVTPPAITQHRACGKRPGHDGEHGPWGRWFKWRTMLANRIDP